MSAPAPVAAASRWYVDVAPVRVQTFLGEVPELQYRIRASAALAAAADPEKVAEALPSLGLEFHDEGGQGDGVVNLVATDETTAHAWAVAVLAHLRSLVPGCDFEAVYGRGTDYLDAVHGELGDQRARGETVRSFAAVRDVVVGPPCDKDRRSIAVRRDKHERLGRNAQRLWSSFGDEERGLAPRRLAQALGEHGEARAFPRDFDRLGRCGIDEKRNALATVFADGNAMGRFFQTLAGRQDADKHAISVAVTEATQHALSEATLRITQVADAACDLEGRDQIETLPISVHVAAGDDLMVSLPASLGIEFTYTFLREFDARMKELDAPQSVIDEVGLPSCSAGIVVSRTKFPFAFAATSAERQLREAKRAVGGERASLAFLDTFRDDIDDLGAVFDLETLGALGETVIALRQIPRSTVSTLREHLRTPDPVVRDARVSVTLARRGTTLDPGLVDMLERAHADGSLAPLLLLASWWWGHEL